MKWSRSWIGTTLSVAFLAGCATEEAVFVDMERARAALPEEGAGWYATSPAPLGVIEGAGATLEAPPLGRPTAEAGARAAAVLTLLWEQTNQTLVSLTEAYERRALMESAADVAELRARLRRSLAEFDERLLENAERIIRSRAPQRGRLLARLAFLAGFPPSRPRKSPIPWATALDSEWARETADLKERIEAWDDETYRLLDRMVEQHHDSRDAVASAVSAQIRQLRESVRERASREVAALLGDGGQAWLGDLIADNPPPASAGSAVTVEVPPMSLRSPRFGAPDQEERPPDALQGRLGIFLRVHGYKQARSPRAGRDATGEFIAWLKTTQNGPSGS